MLQYPVGRTHEEFENENVYPIMGKENGERLVGMPPKTPGTVSKRQPFTSAIGGKEKSKLGGSTPVRKALGSIGNLIGTSGVLRPADTGLPRKGRDGSIKPTNTRAERVSANAGQKDTSCKTNLTASLLKPRKSSKQDVPAKMVTESKAEVNQRPEDPIGQLAVQFAKDGIEHVHFSGDQLAVQFAKDGIEHVYFSGDNMQVLLEKNRDREIATRVEAVKAALSCGTPWPSFQVTDRASLDNLEELLPSEPVFSPLSDAEHLQYPDFPFDSEVGVLFEGKHYASLLPDLPDDFGMEYSQSPPVDA